MWYVWNNFYTFIHHQVAGLSEVAVNSAADMFHCLEKGSCGRTVGSTAMNLQSSRSHAIFTVYVELKKKDSR